MTEDAFEPSPTVTGSLGRLLRQTREKLGMSIADVSDLTKFSQRQIEAVESNQMQLNTASEIAYVRGFIRSYARVLNLDVPPLLAMLPQPQPVQTELTPVAIGQTFHERGAAHRHNKVWLGAAVSLGVLVLSFGVWHFTTPISVSDEASIVEANIPAAAQPAPSEVVATIPVEATLAASAVVAPDVVAQSAAPVAAPITTPAVAQANTLLASEPTAAGPQLSKLRFEFDDDAWVQVKDKDGKMLSSKLNRRGSQLNVEGYRPFNLVVGHAVAVRMYDQDKQVDLKPYIDVNVARLTLQ